MEDLLKQILCELKDIKADVNTLKGDVSSLKADMTEVKADINEVKADITGLKEGQSRIEAKLDSVYEQTADLTEFRTESLESLNRIEDDVNFLTHKETQNEKMLFNLERKIFTSK